MKKIYINNYLPLILVLIVILCILILISVVYSTHNNCHYCALAEAFSHKTVFVEDYFNKYKMSIDYIQLMDSKIVFHFLPLPALLLLVFPGNYFLGLNILSIIFILSSIILTYCLIKHFTNNNFFIYILLLGVVFGSPFYRLIFTPVSTWMFAEIIQYFLLTLSLLIILKKPNISPILVGILLGLSLLVRYTSIFFVVFFIGWYYFNKKTYKNIFFLISALLPFIAVILYYNYLRFGNILTLAIDKVNNVDSIAQAQSLGIISLEHFPQNFTLILGSLFFLTPFLLWIFIIRFKKDLISFLSYSMILIFTLFYTIYYFHGVESFGGWRFLLDFLPFWIIILSQLFNQKQKLTKYFIFTVGYSILINSGVLLISWLYY